MLLYVNEKLTVVFSLNFSSRRLIIWKTWCSGRDSKPRFSQRVSDLGEKYYSIYKMIIIIHVFLLLSYSSALSVPVTLRLWSGSPCLCDDVVSHWDVGEFVGCAVGGFWDYCLFFLTWCHCVVSQPHLLAHRLVLHQQNICGPLPSSCSCRDSSQGHQQKQEEELMSQVHIITNTDFWHKYFFIFPKKKGICFILSGYWIGWRLFFSSWFKL